MIDKSMLPQYSAKLPRYGHNLGRDYHFTSSCGHLLPVTYQYMMAGDTISGSMSIFTRTQPLLNPANVDIDEFVDYFFVPATMLYSAFGEQKFNVKEVYSSLFNVNALGNLPVESFAALRDNSIGTRLEFTQFQLRPDHYGFDNSFFSMYRLFWHCGLNPNFLFGAWLDDIEKPLDVQQPNVFPMVVAAYNCCYQWFYRLDDREAFSNRSYNIDDSFYKGEDHLLPESSFQLHYRPLFFDYFTRAKVSPLVNTLNLAAANNNNLAQVIDWLSDVRHIDPADADGQIQSAGIDNNTTQMSSQLSSTQSIRQMFAVEKFLQITHRAKKTYDDQTLAHFGFKVPHDVKHELTYLGTQKGTIHIGEVVSTANTATPDAGSMLGDIAGKGYGTLSGNPIKFTAPCDGLFIGIYSAVPRITYYSPLDKQMMITNRLDLPFSEYYKLGMQPLFGYEAFPDGSPESNNVIGWQMRYQQFVQRFGVVSPAFIEHVTGRSGEEPVQRFNDWRSWVISRRPYAGEDGVVPSSPTLSSFLANPCLLNSIMEVNYLKPGEWLSIYGGSVSKQNYSKLLKNPDTMFKRDPLLHFCHANFKLVSTIPSNTLPTLD